MQVPTAHLIVKIIVMPQSASKSIILLPLSCALPSAKKLAADSFVPPIEPEQQS